MKLRLEDLRGKTIDIDVEQLAASYGLRGLADARLWETTEEFLTALGGDEDGS